MSRYAANLSMRYAEHPVIDRFQAAAKDGFDAAGYFSHCEYPAANLAALLKTPGLAQLLFDAPPGDWSAGERNLAGLPGREAARPNSATALRRRSTRRPRLAARASMRWPASRLKVRSAPRCEPPALAAERAVGASIDVLFELINTHLIPGLFLNRQDEAHALLAEVGAPNIKVQIDLHHCQIVEGNVAMKLRHCLPTGRVGHSQIVGVPERQELDNGEFRCNYLAGVIDELGCDGWLGCEYRPNGSTSAGLGWCRKTLREV
jgi:hydroxypyruvate isomerase